MTSAREALRPLPESDWDAAAAAHLLRRAGFGAPPEQLAEWVALGPRGAVDRLVDFPAEEPELEAELAVRGSELDVAAAGTTMDGRNAIAVLRAWWLYRLVRTRHPLREKLTFFWHGHFATSVGKVPRAPLLQAQNRKLRELGPGPFRALLGALARDPAMLVYLDGRLNRRGQPNENWARELLELFSLGIDRYTQGDVDELSRVFTGWGTPLASSAEFVFTPEDHDPGDKLLFGEPLAGRSGPAGIEEGEEALDRVVARPECADFLAGKLLGFFAADAWPAEVQVALAAHLGEHELSTREALRALFGSAWFFAPQLRFGLHRNGIEVAVGAARLLGLQNVQAAGLEPRLRRLGLDLFDPPSVAGWPTGRAWAQAGAQIERFQLGLHLSQVVHTRRTVLGATAMDLEALAPDPAADNAALVEGAAARLWQRAPGPGQRAALLAYLEDCDRRQADLGARERRRAKLRGLVHLLVAAPEFALA